MAFTSVVEYEAAEAAGLCDCSVPLEGHPKLAPALPWEHGRPCAKKTDQRWGWGSLSSIKVAPGPGIQITRPARS